MSDEVIFIKGEPTAEQRKAVEAALKTLAASTTTGKREWAAPALRSTLSGSWRGWR